MNPNGHRHAVRDPLAERRFAYARGAAEDGAWQDAADLYEQALELAPDWGAAWIALGEARTAAGDRAGAATAYREALGHDAEDRLGAGLRLGALESGAMPPAAPIAYVASLFDSYAERFDAHLTQSLAYRSPAHLVDALHATGRTRFAHVVDIGCGTGLGGAAVRGLATCLTGIDLSAGMVARARAKALYDRLEIGEIVDVLGREPVASADLVLAADVFVYIGDLAPVLRASARVLTADGLIAFTTQHRTPMTNAGPGFGVGPDMRYVHSDAYLVRVLDACGFTLLSKSVCAGRREKGEDVPCLVIVASRRPSLAEIPQKMPLASLPPSGEH